MKRSLIFSILLILLLTGCGQEPTVTPLLADESQTSSTAPARSYPIQYAGTNEEARGLLDAALTKAKRDNKRVLVVWGGANCAKCQPLIDLFFADRDIRKLLKWEYLLVPVDGTNRELAQTYGVTFNGIPWLTILDSHNTPLVQQDTQPFEDGDHHNPTMIRELLFRWKAQPWDAEQVFREGMAQAKQSGKLVLVYFGAPWCDWCTCFDQFLYRQEVASILAQDYFNLKIDIERMTNGQAVDTRLRAKGGTGLPWIAILDGEGNKLVTSDSPEGNIGFPVELESVEYLITMFQKTMRTMTPTQLGVVETALKDEGSKVRKALGLAQS
jgi:thiol-disulfide isomerase/thioredoxin